jgi:hypothetical protein
LSISTLLPQPPLEPLMMMRLSLLLPYQLPLALKHILVVPQHRLHSIILLTPPPPPLARCILLKLLLIR